MLDMKGLRNLMRFTNLHCHYSVIDSDFFGKKVGAYRGFVARAKLLVDLWASVLAIEIGIAERTS